MAYAAVASLRQSLDDILRPDSHLIPHHKKLKFLRERLSFLQDFLEMACGAGVVFERLIRRIREAVYEVEDAIDVDVYLLRSVRPFSFPGLVMNWYTKLVYALQIMMPSFSIFERGMELRDKVFQYSYPRLDRLIKRIDSIAREAKDIMEWYSDEEDHVQATDFFHVEPPTRCNISEKSIPVGLDEDLLIIKDRLTGSESKLEVIPIMGMGGIGKTTLAANVYGDPLIEYHFDARAWITLSQVYNVPDILLQVLNSLRKLSDTMLHQSEDELSEHVHKTLCGRRYLIVMDDVWSTKAWDDFRSWELLCAKVFGEECRPAQFMETGMEIAFRCNGLPLAIVVIGGLLSKVKRTPGEWKNVLHKLRYSANEDEDTCLDILLLSYNHLPQHLKACFLYMGVFPQDTKIYVSQVIKLWVAEGFLKQNRSKTLEEVAEECILELAERNLISVSSKGKERHYYTNKIISIHDRLRDLCIRQAQEVKFLHVMNGDDARTREGINNQRRLSLYPDIPVVDAFFLCINVWTKFYDGHSSFVERLKNLRYSCFSLLLVRSLVYTGRYSIPSDLYAGFLLLRVLHIPQVLFFEFPLEILQLCNLRYLAFSYHGEIFLLCFPGGKPMYFSKTCKHFPSVRSFPIPTEQVFPLLNDAFLQKLAFPIGLKELTLRGCRIPWKDMTIVGSLPNLERLKLRDYAFVGPEWEPTEGEFVRLNFLYIDGSDLVQWRAESIHFPILRHLTIENCLRLEAVPSGIGEIQTLQSIELDESSPSAVTSAEEILEEQRSLGNESLHVHIYEVGTAFS
ncbi:UNVERIFIED_CONTAM: putative disease resistance RPP8-like protein 2 [Sesamum radiatum]|uniref:Disease resistance RPP8-like protein 2 n=1 Tax=Sesamum radiatum TaxID=300843 RepID=A0AAW2PPK6_SESRA